MGQNLLDCLLIFRALMKTILVSYDMCVILITSKPRYINLNHQVETNLECSMHDLHTNLVQLAPDWSVNIRNTRKTSPSATMRGLPAAPPTARFARPHLTHTSPAARHPLAGRIQDCGLKPP